GSRTSRLTVMTYSSVRGLHVQVPVEGALEYPRGWLDLGLGWLEDGVPGGCGPGRERLAEVAVTGVFGGGHQALPVGQLSGECAVLGGQVGDPLARFLGLLARGQGELVALVLGEGFGFGGAQGRVVPGGVAAAEFGVGGDGQVPLVAGGGVPVGPVGHDGGEDVLALAVGVLQGLVAGGQLSLLVGLVVVAALGGGAGVGGGAQGGQAGLPGGGADLAELVADVPGPTRSRW